MQCITFYCFYFCVKLFFAPGAKKACESCAEGAKSGSFISTTTRSNDDECFDEESAMQRETEEQVKTTIQSEDQKVPFKMSCDCAKVKEQRPCEQQTEQLVKEVRSL